MVSLARTFVAALLTLPLAAACTPPQGPDEAEGTRAGAASPQGGRRSPASPDDIGQAVVRPIKRSPWFQAACGLSGTHLTRIERGLFPGRSSDIVFVPRGRNYVGTPGVTSHSGPWDYLQKVPLVLYGPGFINPRGGIRLDREVTVADLAPTVAELLRVPWPDDRFGKPISEALVPASERSLPPRLIVTIVWDGGGWNVLNQWPGSWPFLREIMRTGTSIEGAVVGSSPSVTPAIHATIGTGTLPDQHGIADIPVRADGAVADSFRDTSGELMKVPTLADLYDPLTNNEAEVALLATKAWHLGLLGRGSAPLPGDPPAAASDGAAPDKDIAALAEGPGAGIVTNSDLYRLPGYLRRVPGLDADVHAADIEDGNLDSAWMGADLTDPTFLNFTPAWVLYQTRLLKALIEHENLGADGVTDLLFTNYKSIDEIGHRYNMVNPEMQAILRSSDRALGDLTGWLDHEVGRGRWVMALTADHGQAPAPEVTGAWPINIQTLVEQIGERFGVDASDLILAQRPTGLWMNRSVMKANNITLEAVAGWLTDYTLEQNIPAGTTPPEQYRERRDERLFEAAFPARWLPEIRSCSRGGLG